VIIILNVRIIYQFSYSNILTKEAKGNYYYKLIYHKVQQIIHKN